MTGKTRSAKRVNKSTGFSTFKDRLVVVTGAGSGIGRETARTFAGLGAYVIAADLDEPNAAKTAADCGGQSYGVDVSDYAAMSELALQVVQGHGVPDVVVNNAGVGASGRFLDTPSADWDWIVSINLLGVINGCRAFGEHMVKRGSGQVVNISSGLAYTPRSTESAYVATKAGVLAASRCIRADWHRTGVGVSVVCPGVTNTGIVKSTRYSGDRSDPEVVAGAVSFFSKFGHSPESVAAAVVKAARTNKSVVPVGIESRFGWFAQRLVPTSAMDWLARQKFGVV